jgi:hypothetical protein
MNRPTPKEMLTLIKRLPDAESHIHICNIDGKHCVTNEFFSGAFAGRSFEGNNYEEATEQLIDYMYEHLGHDSIVGKAVTESGFPDLDKVYRYCEPAPVLEEEM